MSLHAEEKTSYLPVKGISYYEASRLANQGRLRIGAEISLKHEAANPYDSNAVAVVHSETGAKLGYVPREIAQQYAHIVNTKRIVHARISEAKKADGCINVTVAVTYLIRDSRDSLLSASISTVPRESGVYVILNNQSGRQYVGSSSDMNKRLKAHVRKLQAYEHENKSLQNDYEKYGPNVFCGQVVTRCAKSEKEKFESRHIAALHASGQKLYNSTVDGHGAPPTKGRERSSETISERYGHTKTLPERSKRRSYFKNYLDIRRKRRAKTGSAPPSPEQMEARRRVNEEIAEVRRSLNDANVKADSIASLIYNHKLTTLRSLFNKNVAYEIVWSQHQRAATLRLLDTAEVRELIKRHELALSEIGRLSARIDRLSATIV